MKLSGNLKLFPQLFVTYRKRHRKSTQSLKQSETEKTARSKTGTLTFISVSVEVVNFL